MAFVVIEKVGSRSFPIVGPFPTRREADIAAKKQSSRHGGKITVKTVRQTVANRGASKIKSRRVKKTNK